ncbi:DUF3955 domain-containing protein [Vibrio sp. 10N.222.55.E8]|uniref:DUF3955 domain-containing protein n=1 Tax=Vibrio artabrorum TaxID=446374 RepID=UPI00354C47A3
MPIINIKLYWLPIIISIVGWGCGVAYTIIGSYIDDHGILVEPFALIPLFYLCQLIAVLLTLVQVILRVFKRRTSK